MAKLQKIEVLVRPREFRMVVSAIDGDHAIHEAKHQLRCHHDSLWNDHIYIPLKPKESPFDNLDSSML